MLTHPHHHAQATRWLACSTPASCTCRTKSWCPPPAPLQPTTPLALPLGPARPPQAQASRESRAAVASDLDTLMRSISALSAPADGEASSGKAESGAGSSGRGVSANEARQVVSGLVEQINRLKRKVDEGRRAEAEGIARCRSRIATLLSHSSAPEDGAAGGGGARLADARCDRFVADYLLRTGRHHSASETSCRGVQLAASFDAGIAIRRPPCAPPPTAASPRCSTRGTRRVSLAHVHTRALHRSTGAPHCSCLLLPALACGLGGQRLQAGGARRREAPAELRPSSVGRPLTECRRVTDALLRQDAGPALQWCERESARRHRPPPLLLPLPTAAHSRAAQQAHAALPHCADPPLAARRLCTLRRCSHPAGTLSASPCCTPRTTSCRRAPACQAALAARAAAAAAALPRPRRRGRAAARWTRRGGQCTPPSRLPPHAPPRFRRRGCGVREAPPAAGRLAGGRRGGGEARHGVRLPAAPPRTEKGRRRRRRRGEPGRESATAETGGGAQALLALGTRTSLPHASLLDPGRWRRAVDSL